MIKTPKRYGSFKGAVAAGVILMPFFAVAPLYSFIFLGLIIGFIARGIYRSVIASLITGLITTSLVIIYGVLIENLAFYNFIYHLSASYYLVFQFISVLDHLVSFGTVPLLADLSFYAIALPTIGGFIGGLLRPGY